MGVGDTSRVTGMFSNPKESAKIVDIYLLIAQYPILAPRIRR